MKIAIDINPEDLKELIEAGELGYSEVLPEVEEPITEGDGELFFFGDPDPTRTASKRKANQFDKKIQKLKEIVASTQLHPQPACILSKVSYQHATSTASALNKGKHGDDIIAAWELEPDVGKIDSPHEHPEFKHYRVWVALDSKFVGDRSIFG